MKILFRYGVVMMVAAMVATGCGEAEDAFDKAPAPAQVLNPTWEKTNGGAIITYTLPEDKNLLFVKAQYVNSMGNEVFRSSSRYVNQIEIDGFNDLNPHEVKIISVGHNGKESAPVILKDVAADTSYIELIRKYMVVEKALGGVNIQWHNPSKKTVFVYIDYDSEFDTLPAVQRIFSSELENFDANIRGLDTIPYQVNITVEDFSGNKTAVTDKGVHIPLPEQKIDKKTWTLLQNLSCDGDKYEGKLIYFFDDVIDTNLNGDDNSYFIIHKDDNTDPIQFIDGSSELTSPLLIVIDMHKYVVLSRIKVWQRAFWYDSDNSSSTANSNYWYYQTDNMRSFYFAGLDSIQMSSNPTKKTLASWIFKNSLYFTNSATKINSNLCDIGDPRDANGNISGDKIQEAIDGHEFVLPNLSKPFRYIVIGVANTFGSNTQICSSEITLYGQDDVEYIVEEETLDY